jgi:hypothetical protein
MLLRPRLLVLCAFVLAFPAIAAAQCSPSSTVPSVHICTPTNGQTVSSPVNVTAAAVGANGVSSMKIYLDGTSVYTTSSSTLNASITAAAGVHKLTVKAWDHTGASWSSSLSFTVSSSTGGGGGSACTATADHTVNICAPLNNSTIASPVTVTAAAAASNGVSAMRIYVDSTAVYTQNNTTSISQAVTIADGTHTITVVAWDAAGASFTSAVTVTVSSGSTSGGGSCTATADHTVRICAPANGSTVTSPVSVTAAALASNGVSTMKIYLDGVSVFTTSGSSINTALTISSGSHHITVKAWDKSGTAFSSSVNFTVGTSSGGGGGGGTCTATSDHTVHICTPANAGTVTSPVDVTAAALASNGVSTMKVYLDSVSVFTTSGSSINTNLTMNAGSHHITVKAWDNSGTAFSSAVSFTVTSGTGTLTLSPSSASVATGGTQQFNASTGNSTVNWFVDSVAGGNTTVGTISTGGVYTAPATTGNHTISATNTSTGQSATATVTIFQAGSTGPGAFTYQYDNYRSGANTHETVLTPANVNSNTFGKLGTWTLDGNSFTQPLYVPNVSIGSGTFNVVYVATENDSVYAFNADAPGSAALWKRSFLGSGVTIGTAYTGGRTSIGSSVGITGTPVIDASSNIMYVVVRTTENSANVQRIHAIDIRTGKDVLTPALINPTVSGSGDGSNASGQLPFDALTQNQRPALLLANGMVYVGFGSFSDHTPYHGWVVAYEASNLQFMGTYNNTPDGDGGGFWMAGAGMAADPDGNIYVASGNAMPNASGLFNPPDDIPNGVMKLRLVGSTLSLVDYFAPFNDKCLSADDLDLGSTAPMLLPDGVGGRNLLVAGSKEGRIYLIDRDSPGKFHAGDDSQIVQSILINPTQCGQSGFDADGPMRIYGSAAYWNNNVYLGSVFGPLRQYSISSGKLVQAHTSSITYKGSGQSGRGPQPVVSANGNTNGIVWTAVRDYSTGNGVLSAFNAGTLGAPLYQSTYGSGASFTVPMVMNGKVYIASNKALYVYGLK